MLKKEKTRLVKIVSILLTATISIPLIPELQVQGLPKADVVRADGYDKDRYNSKLGIRGIADPQTPTSDTNEWKGSYVYFGNWTSPMLFRVLDSQTDLFGGDTVFIDSHEVLSDYRFDGTSNLWNMKKWYRFYAENYDEY